MNKKRIIFSLVTIGIVILLLSFTVGRELLGDRQPSLFSFSIINFAGYLFFLLMPVEALIPLYVAEGHNGIALFVLAIITALVAQVVNYIVGYLMSTEVIYSLIGEKKYQKINDKIRNYGILTVLLFNFFPLSSSVLSLAAGMVRFGMRRLLFYTFLGLAGKYFILIYMFNSWFA